MSIQVKAKRTGFYQGHRKRKGARFSIRTEDELGTWMEKVETPKAEPKGKPGPKPKAESKDEA